ncbi:MAG: glycoside hydrolase family 13 protein [Oscillospiraceae bacterium]|nr:glycoside hydrolase family 13 protein [Oscillospiraceae bacterium]
MQIYYNTRDPRCKTPFGAVSSGTEVSLSIRASRELAVSEAILNISYEFDDEKQYIVMAWTGLADGFDGYTASLPTRNRLGPVWYSFTLKRFNQCDMHIGRDAHAPDGGSVFSRKAPPPFQLTVYEGGYDVPEWFGQGVTYHIFPDRFRRQGLPDPSGLVGDRVVHEDWGDTPDFRPDEKGEIRNRDFYGGSLAGVRGKLPYLRSLGVSTIYFSPIFEAASNHRYDTADYLSIDPMFGTEADFTALCREAENMGIRIILDGVFNHTGYNSRYFNGHGFYPDIGATQSQDSPYYPWYDFTAWPHQYASWWDIYTLPHVREDDPSYMDFILDAPDSVVRKWLRIGASGWRLDVADELPGEFIERLRAAAREEKQDAVIIGEVWEDATTKVAYDVRRRYLLGRELDGVMNYPLRNALLDYLLHKNAEAFATKMETLRENYPRQAFYSLMNIIGTHDTPRALTVLGVESKAFEWPREKRAGYKLPPAARDKAIKRLKLAALVQFAFPGSPCVYYGDECGMEGFEDPFNRRGYPWGDEDGSLIHWYARLGNFRLGSEALKKGDIHYLQAQGPLLVFARRHSRQQVLAVVNAGDEDAVLTVPWDGEGELAHDAMTGEEFQASMGHLSLSVAPLRGMLLVE